MDELPLWYSRGYLPHLSCPNDLQTVTFHLADALPVEIVLEYKQLGERFGEAARRKAIEAYLDKGYGQCWLRDERVAKIVEGALLHFDGKRYRILDWVIMPNHVHTLFEQWVQLKEIMHSWKSWTSHEIGKIIGVEGQLWQEENFDRFIRNEEHYQNAVDYIHMNPVKAGLVEMAEEWRFGSAFRRIPS
ncbi:MAG: transposase [Acidobacteria bacterium]|nr:MAG: transposase [Acidobacteriota bacterium]